MGATRGTCALMCSGILGLDANQNSQEGLTIWRFAGLGGSCNISGLAVFHDCPTGMFIEGSELVENRTIQWTDGPKRRKENATLTDRTVKTPTIPNPVSKRGKRLHLL